MEEENEIQVISHTKKEKEIMKKLFTDYVKFVKTFTSVNILGKTYHIKYDSRENLTNKYGILDNIAGLTFTDTRLILIEIPFELESLDYSKYSLYGVINQINALYHTITHEILHAFFSECGLSSPESCNVKWAHNEQLIEWLSEQIDKIHDIISNNKLQKIDVKNYLDA